MDQSRVINVLFHDGIGVPVGSRQSALERRDTGRTLFKFANYIKNQLHRQTQIWACTSYLIQKEDFF